MAGLQQWHICTTTVVENTCANVNIKYPYIGAFPFSDVEIIATDILCENK